MFKLKGSSFGQIFGDRPGMIKNNSFKQLTKKNIIFYKRAVIITTTISTQW
jgi:hypothetical protein